MLPRDVLESEAWHCLPDWARSVVTALAGQYKGSRNGDLSLTEREAKELGVSPEWKLRAGLKLAQRAGLVVLTRPGGNVAGGEKRPNLYALGWLRIDDSEKYVTPAGAMLQPPNEWVKWKRPEDWDRQVDDEKHRAQGKRKKRHPTRVGKVATHGWGEITVRRPTRVGRQPRRAAPHGGETSRDIGWDTERRVADLLEKQPHLTDFDVARAFDYKVDLSVVARIRSEMSSRTRPLTALDSTKINGSDVQVAGRGDDGMGVSADREVLVNG